MGVRYAALMMVASVLVVSAMGVLYTHYALEQQQRRSDSRWCDLLTTVDRPGPVPTTGDPQRDAANRKAQQQLHQLRIDLGCEKE